MNRIGSKTIQNLPVSTVVPNGHEWRLVMLQNFDVGEEIVLIKNKAGSVNVIVPVNTIIDMRSIQLIGGDEIVTNAQGCWLTLNDYG